jgi:general secretion pathway protein B
MSLILEALRKSEAQRRLGQAPDLHSTATSATPRGRLPRWLLPALALMLVGAVAWWLGRMAVPDPSNGMATEAIVAPLPLPLETGPSPVATPDAPASGMSPAASSPPATPAATATDAAAPAAARAPAPAPSPAPAPAVTRPAAETTTPPAAAPQSGPQPAPGIPPATHDAPAAAATATDGVEHDLLRLADLPAATRARLPELRISMHVFAEEPTRRFAIIDGRRVGEGGLLEGQGVVEAIRRDGIVVDFDGQRVLLPRP